MVNCQTSGTRICRQVELYRCSARRTLAHVRDVADHHLVHMTGVQLVVFSVLLKISGDFKSFAVFDLDSATGGEGSPLNVE